MQYGARTLGHLLSLDPGQRAVDSELYLSEWGYQLRPGTYTMTAYRVLGIDRADELKVPTNAVKFTIESN